MTEVSAPVPAEKRPVAVRILTWAVIAVASALLALLLLHVLVRPVSPAQQAPLGHFGGPCVLCHFVSEGADVVPVD